MIFGNIVTITNDSLGVSWDLLRPLSVDLGAMLDGVYHPPRERDDYRNVVNRPDVIFAPFPFDSWQYLVRISVAIQHRPGSLYRVTEILAEHGLNLLTANIVRFGHRSVRWTLIAECADVRRDVGTNPEQVEGLVEKTFRRFREEVVRTNDQLELHEKFLFGDHDDGPQGPRVSGRRVYDLARYFHYVQDARTRAKKANLPTDRNELRFQGMRFQAEANKAGLRISSSKWRELLSNKVPRSDTILGVASIDTYNHFLRIALFGEADLERFWWIRVRYHRTTGHHDVGPGTSKGLLRDVTRLLRDENLWLVGNRTSFNEPTEEEGFMEFLFEIQSSRHRKGREKAAKSLCDEIGRIRTEAGETRYWVEEIEGPRRIDQMELEGSWMRPVPPVV